MIKGFFEILGGIAMLLFVLTTFLALYFLDTKNNKASIDLERNMYITDIYYEEGKYIIGERTSGPVFGGDVYKYTSICDKSTQSCLKWSIEGLKSFKNDIYIYIYPFNFSLGGNTGLNLIFENTQIYSVTSNVNEAKIFGIFTQERMNFYSLNDLKNNILTPKQANILLDLYNSPRFLW